MIGPIQNSDMFPQMQGRVVFDRHAKTEEWTSDSAPPKVAAQHENELLVQLQDFPSMVQNMRATIVRDAVCKFLDRIHLTAQQLMGTGGFPMFKWSMMSGQHCHLV